MKYSPIDMHKKKSSVLIVHCSDPRFQNAYQKFISSLGHYHDLLVFPGASKAITDHKVVVENIKLLHELHGFETIHILDHISCGAFGEVSDEIKTHCEYLQRAKRTLESSISSVSVIPHLLGEEASLDVSVAAT